ncbi:hypothetical protein E0Z10_g9508 [Xylaria hypoxylon]|uniref:Anaphase-promoting complex subunit 11 n=1 Tax=Xylaria hypoxylon TaxID=37992 RepID=A0A4Z0Y5A5_9PEZI|nr:hypothetical protein E0Z10_g9508 [Xylaria hypoxylon]
MSTHTSRKRKPPSTWSDEPDLTPETKKTGKASNNEKRQNGDDEKRLRRFRAKAPTSFDVVYQRATEQRSRCGTSDCPEEEIEITGSTGNIYKVHVAQLPSCDCPQGHKGNQCKHIVFVMSRVLRARADLVYQLALLSAELREIFEGAPSIEIDGENNSKSQDPNRKQIEGDCPICFTPFEGTEDTVYCRATCGQNIHKECFEMWAATKRQGTRDAVTCPMCRSPWQGDEDMVKKIKNTGIVGAGGYVNVAEQLGISGIRGPTDESTYYAGPRRGTSVQGFPPGSRSRPWR